MDFGSPGDHATARSGDRRYDGLIASMAIIVPADDIETTIDIGYDDTTARGRITPVDRNCGEVGGNGRTVRIGEVHQDCIAAECSAFNGRDYRAVVDEGTRNTGIEAVSHKIGLAVTVEVANDQAKRPVVGRHRHLGRESAITLVEQDADRAVTFIGHENVRFAGVVEIDNG